MSDLELLLHELRPAPDPAWAARLDDRVAERFARPPRFQHLGRNLFAFAAVALPVALLVFVVARMNTGSDTSSNSSSAASVSRPMAASGAATASGPPEVDRAQIRSAELTLTAPNADVESVSDRAMKIVDGLGGYVSDSSVSATSTHSTASLTLAIPSAKLQQGLAALSALGHVTRRTQDTTDVTDQKEQLEASVRDARADRAGLRARLAKAGTDRERSHLRAELDTAARRITAREREVAKLTRQVAYAAVALTIRGQARHGAAVVAKDSHWTPGDALHDAGRVLEVSAGVLLLALAVALPIGLVIALIVLAARITVRRKRERALEMA